jgi:hypothetical protein
MTKQEKIIEKYKKYIKALEKRVGNYELSHIELINLRHEICILEGKIELSEPESKDELYPKEFVEFCILNNVWGISSGIRYFERSKNVDLFFNSLDDLFEYFKSKKP